jgi:hypothetical protein
MASSAFRYHVAAAVVVVAACGCQPGPPSRRLIKELAVEAAAMSGEQLQEVEEARAYQDIDNQNLTAAFLWTAPTDPPCRQIVSASAGEESDEGAIELLVDPRDREALRACLCRSHRDGERRTSEAQGESQAAADSCSEASLLWKETITAIKIEASGDTAAGTVSFESRGCFHGAVPFEAKRGPGGWAIVAWELPDSGTLITREDPGRWRAHPVGQPSPPIALEELTYDGVAIVDLQRGPKSDTLLDGRAIPQAELAARVAARVIAFRSEPDVPVARIIATLELLQTTPTPPQMLIWVPRSLVGTCWCTGDRAPWAVRTGGWWTTGEPVTRRSLWGKAASLCIDPFGYRLYHEGWFTWPHDSLGDIFDSVEEVVTLHPETRFTITADPHAPAEQLDRVFDLLYRAKAPQLFLSTDGRRGTVWTIKPPVPGPCQTKTAPDNRNP